MKKYAFMSLLVLSLAGQAQANLESGNSLLTLQAGFAIPISRLDFAGNIGDGDVFADPGGTFGVQYLYSILPMLSVGLEMSDSIYGERSSREMFPLATSLSSGHSFDVLTIVRGSFIPHSRVHPFVEGGLGIGSTALKVEATPIPGAQWLDTHTSEKRTLIDSTETGVALVIGGGVDFFVNERVFIGCTGRFLIYPNRTFEPTDSGVRSGFGSVDGGLATFNTMFHVGWKF